MTRLDDVVPDVASLLALPFQALDGAAYEICLPAQQRSLRAAARGRSPSRGAIHGVNPDRMRRADGTNDLPSVWLAARKRLIAAIERALAEVDAQIPQPSRGELGPQRR